jgi:2-oxoglutarate ferredoxin oxidoreductase subunit beta
MNNTEKSFTSDIKPLWCPGCGNYGTYAALNKALVELGLQKENVVMVSGIGCSCSMPHTFNTYGVHSLHGRLLPVAEGIKLANDSLTVIGIGGDGDGYGIGVGHLIHIARRNVQVTYIVVDNAIYGLTTGQASPTSLMGTVTKSTPFGCIETPENPIAVALAAGASYVARAFSGDPAHMTELIKSAIQHKGFALIDVLSPCVSFNSLNTSDWYRQRVYKLGQDHDASDLSKAMEKALETEKSGWSKIPIGVFYKKERPTYTEMDITLKKGPLVNQQSPTREQILEVLEEQR